MAQRVLRVALRDGGRAESLVEVSAFPVHRSHEYEGRFISADLGPGRLQETCERCGSSRVLIRTAGLRVTRH